MKNKKKASLDYMWIISITYFSLGFFNILFAWLGLLCFLTPIILATLRKGKSYCNKPMPKFLKSKLFRYGFLIFFMTMFLIMLFNTYLVFAGTRDLKEVLQIIWSFKLPWKISNTDIFPLWVYQFALGFYSMMLTSTILGIITMILYKPKSWCVYCPIGTMTQLISKTKYNPKN